MDFPCGEDEADSFPGFAVFSPDSSPYSPEAGPSIIISSLPDASNYQLHSFPPPEAPAYTEQAVAGASLERVGNVGVESGAAGYESPTFVRSLRVEAGIEAGKTRLEENPDGAEGKDLVGAEKSEQNLEMLTNFDHSSDPVCQSQSAHLQYTILWKDLQDVMNYLNKNETERSKLVESKFDNVSVDGQFVTEANLGGMGNVSDQNVVLGEVGQEKKTKKAPLEEKLDGLKVNDMDYLDFIQTYSDDIAGANLRRMDNVSAENVISRQVGREKRAKKPRLEEKLHGLKVNDVDYLDLIQSLSDEIAGANLRRMDNVSAKNVISRQVGREKRAKKPRLEEKLDGLEAYDKEHLTYLQWMSADSSVDCISGANLRKLDNVSDENVVSRQVGQEEKGKKPSIKEKLGGLKVDDIDYLKFIQLVYADSSVDGISGANVKRLGNASDENGSKMKSRPLDFVAIGGLDGIKAKKPRLEENSNNGDNIENRELMCDSRNKAPSQSNLKILPTHESVGESISATNQLPNPAKSTSNELFKPSQSLPVMIANEVVDINANATKGTHISNLGENLGGLLSNEIEKDRDVQVGKISNRPPKELNNTNKSGMAGGSLLVKIHATDGNSTSSKVDAEPTEPLGKSIEDESVNHLQDNNLLVTTKTAEIESTRAGSNSPKGRKLPDSVRGVIGKWMCPKPSSRSGFFEDAPGRSASSDVTFMGAVRALCTEACQVMENEHILDVAARRGYTFPGWRGSRPTH